MNIPILYEDNQILVVDKPRDMHVHPTKLSRGELSVQSVLEEEGTRRLFPVHRLDRPVGGVLLFAKNAESASTLGASFRWQRNIEKRYLCVVRGWLDDAGLISRPLRQAPGKSGREAKTKWKVLSTVEASWPDGSFFPHSRYSLVECMPLSGRYHQIRRHFSGVSHPIIGDIAHGDNPRNRIWLRETQIDGLMLRAQQLCFLHPTSGQRISLNAAPDARFLKVARVFNWEENLVSS